MAVVGIVGSCGWTLVDAGGQMWIIVYTPYIHAISMPDMREHIWHMTCIQTIYGRFYLPLNISDNHVFQMISDT